MERCKNSSSRNHKKISALMNNEFFALGNRDEIKSKSISSKSQNSSIERKRECSAQIGNTSKKPRVGSVRLINDLTNLSNDFWEEIIFEYETVDFINAIYAALDQNDKQLLLRLLCGAVKQLISSLTRSKLDIFLYITILYIAKLLTNYFCQDILTSGLMKILRRENNLKTRLNSYANIFAANLLTKIYEDQCIWPDSLLRMYIEDASNERIWVDNEFCIPFVKNIITVFKTNTPPAHLILPLEIVNTTSSISQNFREINEENYETSIQNVEAITVINNTKADLFWGNFPTKIRQFNFENDIEKYVIDAIKEQFNKRQQDNHNKNLLKFLCTASGLAEIRSISISRLELWIHNGKLIKFAQQLLSYVCFNISSNCGKDFEVLAILVKIRLKTKPLINFYISCIKEMIIQQPSILGIILKLVVQNELSNTRNPNNMGMLATMFQTCPDDSAIYLAEIYKEFFLQRDDYLRTLRVFLRELVRMLRFDINIAKFTKTLFGGRQDLTKQIEQSEHNERIFHSIVDITCLSILLSVSPQVREATMSLRTSRDMKSNPVLLNFYFNLSQIQFDAMSWMYETVPRLFKLQNTDYSQALHKLLLLENPEQYSRHDQWPSEPERGTLLRIVSETPVHEDALLRIILIGITKEISFSIPETVDIIILVIKRASAMRVVDYPAVQTKKFDIIDFLFSMAEYHHPDNIKLPPDYEPPKLAIIVLYWKAWLIMLMISAHNPSTFGAFCWDHYPTMKILMEMCITNQINENILIKEEFQILQIERDNILEFESYLAAQTSQAVITEENAILLSQLMLMNPMGPARKIPSVVLEQLRYLNKSLKLGHLLCRCRKPDLLLDIIQRQGTTQSMPWLSDLVQNSEGDFNHLPVQCLCEFLMFNGNLRNEDNNRDVDLINFLRDLVLEPESNKHNVCEVLDYIFRRLSSTVKQSRVAALRGLKVIFKCSEIAGNDWLITLIPQIPHFEDVRRFIIPQLRSACQVENCPKLVMCYIQFIATHTLNDPVTDMLDHVMDMAQLIVERSTMFQYIIPASNEIFTYSEYNDISQESKFQTLKCLFVMFNNYIIKLREHNEPYEWPEYPDLLMVQFNDGIQLPLHLNVIHAFIILLTYSNANMSESIPILDYWFPLRCSYPMAYLPNLPHDPVQIFPDWLKLKMIRSLVDRLVEAAIHDLTPDQIVLFVQNFGSPINSMSKLLALLDHAVIEQLNDVKDAILNKAYLAQLIEIQQSRGAKNGHFTVQALNLQWESGIHYPIQILKQKILENINFEEFLSFVPKHNFDLKRDDEELISLMFKCPKLDCVEENNFRQLIHNIFEHQINVGNLVDFFFCFELHLKKNYINNILKQKNHICTFLRTVLKFRLIFDKHLKHMFNLVNENKEKLLNQEAFSRNSQGFFYILLSLNTTLEKLFIFVESPTKKPLSKTYLKKNMLFDVVPNIFSNINKTYSYSEELSVDWLADIDPEFTIVLQTLQSNFIFSDNCGDFRYYLLSLLCHQTNWGTLLFTLNNLLQEISSKIDCTTVLNFIEAIINNPKLWQGRDKDILKIKQQDILFSLGEAELNVFTHLILKEGEKDIYIKSVKCDFTICSRISLFLKLIYKSNNPIVKFIGYVFKFSGPQLLKKKILEQLYVMHPSIQKLIYNCTEDTPTILQKLKGYRADKTSNYLITCFGNLFLKKDFESLSSDSELLIRKLAATHPILLLRQLSLLSSFIQEKALVHLRIGREEGFLNRFFQILYTLELLQPMLFDDVYKVEFQSVLDCYFSFLNNHSDTKDVYSILLKFIELLQTYVNINPFSAFTFIEGYINVLNKFSIKFNSIASLQQLVQCIVFLKHNVKFTVEYKKNKDKQYNDNISNVKTPFLSAIIPLIGNKYQIILKGDTTSFDIPTSSSKSGCISSHFVNMIKIIRHSNSEDVLLGPLQEIENFSLKRFSILSDIFDKLLELIFSPNALIRSQSFILLIRHLKNNPGHTDINRCTLNAYVRCLRNDNASVASTAIDYMPELILLLQEHIVEILMVAFSLGIKSHLHTSIQIKRVLQIYLLQHGY